MKNLLPLFGATLLLSACTSELDMHGVDPVEYYSQHPIENKVASRQLVQLVHFTQNTLSTEEKESLRVALRPATPLAADAITIQLAKGDMHNMPRQEYLVKLLHGMGYTKINIHFQPSADVKRGEALVALTYTAVVAPDCPDWRMSPVTTYSNTTQGNFRCATTTDIGLMIADPHDLARGTGDVPVSTERSSKVIQDYNTGKDLMPTTLSAGGSSSGGSGSGSGAGSGSGSSSSSPTPAPSGQ